MASHLRQLVEARIELSRLVKARRRAGDSWRAISIEVRERTDIDVAPETIRQWFEGVQ